MGTFLKLYWKGGEVSGIYFFWESRGGGIQPRAGDGTDDSL